MGLILELVSSGAEPSPPATRKVFGAAGGTIGRARHSDWVLPDSKVSARHARISCENAVYYIEDTSTNGIYLNSPDNRLEPGRLYPLQSGDRLLIQPYELVASITSERDETRLRPAVQRPASVTSDPFGFDSPVGAPVAGRPHSATNDDPFAPLAVPPAEDELDPLKLIDPVPSGPPTPRPTPVARDLEAASPMEAHFQPPPILPSAPPPVVPTTPPPASFIPDNYDPLAPETGIRPVPIVPSVPTTGAGEDTAPHASPNQPAHEPVQQRPFPDPFGGLEPAVTPEASRAHTADRERAVAAPPAAPPVQPRPAPQSPRAAAVTGDLAGVLAAAGLHDVPVTPELAQKFGEILRVVVLGVMDVLRSRHQVKDEFRMRMTYFRPVDNNPLKFSVNVEDALHNLLVKRNEAYLGPVEAFQDAFDDLRNHQLAMLAGMRVAFDSTLAEFDPDRLQAQFDRRLGKNSVFAVPMKMRYWELFREHRDEIARDPDAAFRRLFGDAFTRAYEEQLKRLKDTQGRE